MPYFDSGRGQIQRGSVHPTRRQGSLCHTVKVAYKKATTHREIKIIFISKNVPRGNHSQGSILESDSKTKRDGKEATEAHQSPTEAIRGQQKPSEAIRGRQRLQTKRWQGCRKCI